MQSRKAPRNKERPVKRHEMDMEKEIDQGLTFGMNLANASHCA